MEKQKAAKVRLKTTSLALSLWFAPRNLETKALLPTKIIVVKAKANII